jgi:uncharacterized membrane protein
MRDMKSLAAWTGIALIIFGALLILAQIIWPERIANVPEASFLGASLKTTMVGLMVLFIGAVLLVTAAIGRGNSN